jgi:hypothetical protein
MHQSKNCFICNSAPDRSVDVDAAASAPHRGTVLAELPITNSKFKMARNSDVWSNGHPKPYIWTKTATEIFSKVARAKQVLESQH